MRIKKYGEIALWYKHNKEGTNFNAILIIFISQKYAKHKK